MPHRIGIIGLRQDRPRPARAVDPAPTPTFELAGRLEPARHGPEGVPHAFSDYREMLKLPDLDAVAICTPPQVRHAIARAGPSRPASSALLEKPPGRDLERTRGPEAHRRAAVGRTLFTTWHAQYNDGVDAAREGPCRARSLKRLLVTWKEDVRRWHPGQEWIWQAGGFGVFDPGINALSIVTRIMPAADLRQAGRRWSSRPIRTRRSRPASSSRSGLDGEDLQAAFDWRQTGAADLGYRNRDA